MVFVSIKQTVQRKNDFVTFSIAHRTAIEKTAAQLRQKRWCIFDDDDCSSGIN